MSTQISVKHNTPRTPDAQFQIFEEAREAVIKLKTLKPFLMPRDEETLELLMDKELMTHLVKSLKETEKGKLEPLEHILK
ncbi:MAG: hypothetical protein A3H64_00460 [Candidatus Ryanbacteria bacterium RIFCSPLOWO2_02_FULL_45_11c]|uniref:Uncharacterized protein n=1 Tax=Candidatus Ryanbacteria bacterium RIFCSPLOWO2_02_FULL_45_11c TaxID=1802128 RepID=A0A1G2GV22_9BACT|nr:MAG: hypothetical protein A3H64_00460 [Candidatus Ryanbacteria bacterium RIFCSPLOWO2_02_FULL_45_11c]